MPVKILPTQVCIRNALTADLANIVANEQLCYEIPWSVASLEACISDGYSFLVMEFEQQIIGHMIVQWVVDEVHLHNVCVIPRYQSAGLGKVWLSHLIDKATQNNVLRISVRLKV